MPVFLSFFLLSLVVDTKTGLSYFTRLCRGGIIARASRRHARTTDDGPLFFLIQCGQSSSYHPIAGESRLPLHQQAGGRPPKS